MAYWSGSLAVLSDAFHTFSAVGGVLIALVAQWLSERKASLAQTYGWARAEIIGALFNGVFLFLMAGYVLWMGAMRLMEPVELRTGAMLLAAAGGIATEVIALRLLYGRQRENLNMRGAFWHVVQTFVGSIIIIISATVVWPGCQIEVMRIVSSPASPASAILAAASPFLAASSAAPTSSSLGRAGETGAETTGAAATSAAQSTAMSTRRRRIERSAGAV